MKKTVRILKILTLVIFFVSLTLLIAGCSTLDNTGTDTQTGEDTTAGAPGIIDQLAGMLDSRSQSLQIVALITILSLAPSILILFTGFTRIVIVLSFTKNALGMQQMPPNQVVIGLSLILTFLVMSPVFDQVKTQAYDPYVAGDVTAQEAADKALVPIREFMFKQTFPSDLDVFASYDGIQNVEITANTAPTEEQIPTRVLLPAFITSEIKRGFMIGFFIYIPFIVIDMIVASTLMSMGMMMLPPAVISLPFKVLLFVLVDGWVLTIQSLLTSFG